MLEIQKWLVENSGDFEKLERELGITSNFHSDPMDRRVILNYSQINSRPKDHPIVKECRGLVLNRNTYEVVAKAFNRFFNLGEIPEQEDFLWNSCEAITKEDGSLILVYNYREKLCVNTRNSFSDGCPNGHSETWEKLVLDLLPEDTKRAMLEPMWNNTTFVFEFCSPYNRVVKAYPSSLYLLGVFEGKKEFTQHYVDKFAKALNLKLPRKYKISSLDSARELVEKLAKENPTNEGIVFRDQNGMRIKWKTLTYLALHRVVNNGNVMLPSNLIPLILKNEHDEIKVYFPELREQIERAEGWLEHWRADTWAKYCDIQYLESQKDFALACKYHEFSSVMFAARKNKRCVQETFNSFEKLLVDKYEEYLNGKKSFESYKNSYSN